MCIIIDANMFSDFLNLGNSDLAPVRDWMEDKNAKIVYSSAGKLRVELHKHTKMRKRIHAYRRKRKLKLVSEEEVAGREKQLRQMALESDDAHIIALAQVSKARLLVSRDKDLCSDFENQELVRGGRTYQTARDKRFLTRDLCP